jgi:hypothetical protein
MPSVSVVFHTKIPLSVVAFRARLSYFMCEFIMIIQLNMSPWSESKQVIQT